MGPLTLRASSTPPPPALLSSRGKEVQQEKALTGGHQDTVGTGSLSFWRERDLGRTAQSRGLTCDSG